MSWELIWVDQVRNNFEVSTPEYKCCKKRSDCYKFAFDETWYKSPYKYHIRIRVSQKQEVIENLVCRAVLSFEDGETVRPSKQNQRVISVNQVKFKPCAKYSKMQEAIFGPFHFNVCSYKYDGKRFKLRLFICQDLKPKSLKEDQKRISLDTPLILSGTLMEPPLIQSSGQLPSEALKTYELPSYLKVLTHLISPAFVIRAKKPIHQPGLKKKKEAKKNIRIKSEIGEKIKSNHKTINIKRVRTRPLDIEEEEDDPVQKPKKQFTEADVNPQFLVSYFQSCSSENRKKVLDGILHVAYPMELIYLQHQLVSGSRSLCDFFLNPNLMQNQLSTPFQTTQQQQIPPTIESNDSSFTQYPRIALYPEENNHPSTIDDIFEDAFL